MEARRSTLISREGKGGSRPLLELHDWDAQILGFVGEVLLDPRAREDEDGHGGVLKAVVPDNLKSAVIKADRFDSGLDRTYAEMAAYYGTAILPARPRKPRDKAKVEVAAQVAQRWILARLRNDRGGNHRISSVLSAGYSAQAFATAAQQLNRCQQ